MKQKPTPIQTVIKLPYSLEGEVDAEVLDDHVVIFNLNVLDQNGHYIPHNFITDAEDREYHMIAKEKVKEIYDSSRKYLR